MNARARRLIPRLRARLGAFVPAARPPLPLLLMQPVLGAAVRHVASTRPEIFRRLGDHKGKVFLIDPLDLPFVLLLSPHPSQPRLRACDRRLRPAHDARIAASFLTLFDMIDGRLDGDSLFFTRSLTVEGDTEAVVSLRNALDDMEGSVADTLASPFRAPGRGALAVLRRLRERGHGRS